MSSPQVMLLSPLPPAALRNLEAHFEVLRCDETVDRTAYLKEMGQKCRAVLLKGHVEFGEAELKLLPNLEIAACSSAGVEAIDHDALLRAGISLTNVSQALKDEVADTALMLILAARKSLLSGDAYVRSGDWGKHGSYPLLSTLKGKRAGILGLGTIGQEIAARLAPMKIEIGYCTRRQREVTFPYFPDAAALATWCDILVVVVPGGQETKALVNQEVLNKLGPDGTLINLARGSVVDEIALIDCLRDGQLGSAGLDVFQNEPHPDPALTSLPNVVLYPHHASGTRETRDAMAQLAVENLFAHFNNHPLPTPVNSPSQPQRILE